MKLKFFINNTVYEEQVLIKLIIINNNNNNNSWLIYIAFQLTTNISRKYTVKTILKCIEIFRTVKISIYRDLIKEVCGQSNVIKEVPVIVGAMREIPRSLHNSLEPLGVSVPAIADCIVGLISLRSQISQEWNLLDNTC